MPAERARMGQVAVPEMFVLEKGLRDAGLVYYASEGIRRRRCFRKEVPERCRISHTFIQILT